MEKKIIGIDLGTTNSAMAVLEGNEPTIIVNSDGHRTTPSVVAWKDGERIVGDVALNQQVANPENTIYSVKRFIGRSYGDLSRKDLEGLHYKIENGENGRPVICANNKKLLPEEVSAAVLSKLKADAEKFLGSTIDEAIITVPAYFDDNQRQATKDAGKIAGLNVQRIINEPTAAAMAYGFGTASDDAKKILVFDLGGGTFDVSILDVTGNAIEVVATNGDNHLGGDIWDSQFCEWLCDKFKNEHGVDLTTDAMTHARVLEAARKAKHALSTASSTQISLPFITAGPNGPLHMDYDITREQFEDITKDLLQRCKNPVNQAMSDAGVSMADIDDILLVGGSTRMPAVQDLIRKEYGKEPSATVNPDEVVAMGACIQGGVLTGECQGMVLLDVNSMSLGIKTTHADGSEHVACMIPANTQIPAEETKQFTTKDDNQDSVEVVIVQGPDEDYHSPNNKVLGTSVLSGIPPMPAGQPKIEITLTYDVNGIVHVSAKELTSGKHMEATIEGSTKLSDNEVEMLASAEKQQAK